MTRSFKLAAGLALCCAASLVLAGPRAEPAGSSNAARPAEDPHANHHHHHHQTDKAPGYARHLAAYRLPELSLVRADGSAVRIDREIDDGRPVVLNFIFTTCTAVCPLLSQTAAEFRRQLGADAAGVHFISVSIDPEQDTPQRLRAYAAQFDTDPRGADKDWSYYTGSKAASVTLQKAFQAYFGDKMHHRPITFMRSAPGAAWTRLEGFATPADLLSEYRKLAAAP